MRKYVIPFAAATLLAQSVAFANEGIEKRFALVIGNQIYQNKDAYSDLASAIKDADDVKDFLSKEAGFKVFSVKNATKKQMESALESFKEVLKQEVSKQDAFIKENNLLEKPKVISLVYYSGHGIQPKDKENVPTFLAPVDAISKDDSHVSTKKIYDTLASVGTRGNIVLLDACRSNQPTSEEGKKGRLKTSQGVVEIKPGVASQVAFLPSNTLVGFATRPQEYASGGADETQKSVYTDLLLSTLKRPNLKLREVMDIVKGDSQGTDQENTYQLGETVNDFLTSFRFISTNSTTTGWSQ